MKKLIVLVMIMAVILLVAALARAHSPANDLKPTFISPTPGLYVNGWPAFTVSYPKEWVEIPQTAPGVVFIAVEVRPDLSIGAALTIAVFRSPSPLEDWASLNWLSWHEFGADIKTLSDKPSRLKDGTPAREGEVEWLATWHPSQGRSVNDGRKVYHLLLVTKRDGIWVEIMVSDDRGRIGDDLKRIAYSLTFQPDREKPANVPPDVRAFLDMYCADLVSSDVKTIMAHYSDRFRHSGASKAFYEQVFPVVQWGIVSCEAIVTVFEPRGDKAYVDGIILGKSKVDTDAWRSPMQFQQGCVRLSPPRTILSGRRCGGHNALTTARRS